MSADRGPTVLAAEADKPALLGGTPAHKGGWPKWPEWRESWEPDVLKVLRSGRWCGGGGGGQVGDFEAAYAKLLGAKRCVATASGTTALITALYATGLDAGDEVIVSPYTFVASYTPMPSDTIERSSTACHAPSLCRPSTPKGSPVEKAIQSSTSTVRSTRSWPPAVSNASSAPSA
ncbi:MAG: DegT/DnrJ/EryC1/StrS family aminotransferase [Thermoguttaceae bacterium]